MENNNLLQNLYLKQFNQSDAIAYNREFLANTSDYNFQLLDNAYRDSGKIYAKLKIAIETISWNKAVRRSASSFFRVFIIFS
jgi:hypothetical protein